MRYLPWTFLACAIVGTACTSSQTLPDGSSGDPNPGSNPTPVGHLSLLTSANEMLQAESIQLTALVRTDADTLLPGAKVLWASTRSDVATVDASGRVIGVSPGEATILVGYESQVLSRKLTVFSNAPVSVVVNSQISSINVGASVTLPVEVRGAHDLLITSPAVTWSSDHPEIATVSSTGVVKGIVPGTATIIVASGSVSTRHPIQVRSITPLVLQLSGGVTDTMLLNGITSLQATVIATDSLPIITPVNWGVLGTAVTVSPTGLVTAVASGSATVVAWTGNARAERTFTVHNFSRYATAVGIQAMENLVVDESESVPAYSQAGNSSGFIEPATISTSDASVAKILPSGAIFATGPGTVTITAKARFAPPATKTIRVFPRTTAAAVPAVQSATVTTGSAGTGWTWYQPNIVMKETAGAAGYRVTAVRMWFVGTSDRGDAFTFYRINAGATRTLWDDLAYYDDPFGVAIPSTSHPTAVILQIEYSDDAGNKSSVSVTVGV